MTANTVLIKKKFSKASKDYDKLSLIQREVADELFTKIGSLDLMRRVLDIGIGTGYLSQRLRSKYPNLRLHGIDLASGMLEICRQKIRDVLLVQSDAKYLPFKEEAFDLVISNLTYQWVGDLGQALQNARSVLKEKSKFYFTIFSENTLIELRQVIFELWDKDTKTRNLQPLAHLPKKTFVEKALKDTGFTNIKIGVKVKKEHYPNLWELLNWLKMIGANKYWPDKLYDGLSARNFIDNISERYKKKFYDGDNIFATFEVLFIEAVK